MSSADAALAAARPLPCGQETLLLNHSLTVHGCCLSQLSVHALGFCLAQLPLNRTSAGRVLPQLVSAGSLATGHTQTPAAATPQHS